MQVAAVESGTVGPRREPPNSQADDGPDDSDGVLIDGRLYVMTAGGFVTVQRDDLVVRGRQNSGIMHGSDRDQGGLIFDLIEEFRAPFGDRLVLGMLGRGFQPELGREGNLRTSVRRLLVRAFHRMWNRPIRWRGKMLAPSRILEQQAKGLAGAFLAEETYRPFQFRW